MLDTVYNKKSALCSYVYYYMHMVNHNLIGEYYTVPSRKRAQGWYTLY